MTSEELLVANAALSGEVQRSQEALKIALLTVEKLKVEVAYLRRMKYGRSSEQGRRAGNAGSMPCRVAARTPINRSNASAGVIACSRPCDEVRSVFVSHLDAHQLCGHVVSESTCLRQIFTRIAWQRAMRIRVYGGLPSLQPRSREFVDAIRR